MREARADVAETSVVGSHEPEQEAHGQGEGIEQLLAAVDAPEPATTPARSGMLSARLLRFDKRSADVMFRGASEPESAHVSQDVDGALLQEAIENQQAVLLECVPGSLPVVVGILQTRLPRVLNLRAETINLEGAREVLVRSGRAALRLRNGGDVELVGTRISAASRGLFKLVGRILRLN